MTLNEEEKELLALVNQSVAISRAVSFHCGKNTVKIMEAEMKK